MGRFSRLFALSIIFAPSCGEAPPPREEKSAEPAPPVSRPIRKGFTQKPADLPPPAPALLTAEELRAAAERNPSAEECGAAQEELRSLLRAFERDPSSLDRLRRSALEHAREGRLALTTAVELSRAYQHPNDPAAADAQYKGRAVLLTGTVVPENVAEIGDVYKIFEREPYVRDPLLLQTDYDVIFVRCRLAQPSVQKLPDWQEIHLVGIVRGKAGSDVWLESCAVL